MSSKTDKLNSKDCSAAASPIPESRCVALDNAWPESFEPPPKSKGKSVKLKKNSKTENSKKLIRQGSKDSVVLVGYKNLKAPFSDPGTKYKEGEAPLSQEEERDMLLGASSSCLRTNANFIFESGATSALCGNSAVDSAGGDEDLAAAAAAHQKTLLKTNSDAQELPQAGTGATAASNQPPSKAEHRQPPWPAGVKQIEVKPSTKDPHQGDRVTVLLPCRTEGGLSSGHPEAGQLDSVFERPGKEAPQRLVSIQVKGDSIRLPDGGAPSASSRLSDSGIESEPSSFATQLAPGTPGLGFTDSTVAAPQTERPFLSPAPRPVQPSTAPKPSGPAEALCPENTSVVSGVQSSLTSINSLPSDDEGEASSRGSDARGRKSSILVQEQSLVFSGDVSSRPAVDAPDSNPKAIGTSEPGAEGASGSGAGKEPRSEPHTACPSSNSATSSTDLVKRGMVENYFGSCSSTDISEISPVESSAVTLGIQGGAQPEEDEDEPEHEMIENGYYEEGDGYAFLNGVADEEARSADVATQEASLLFEHLGIGYPHEAKDLSKAPLCSNLASSGAGGHGFGRPPCPLTSFSSNLRWYECAPTAQMKA